MITTTTTAKKDSTQLVKESFGRCILKGDLLFERFYEIFLKSNPVIAKMFVNTDMTKQKSLLRQGLNFMILYNTDMGKATAESVLSRIKTSHAKSNMNIKPEYYSFWKSSLLKALSDTDPKFDLSTKKAWEHVIDHGVRYLVSGYNQ